MNRHARGRLSVETLLIILALTLATALVIAIMALEHESELRSRYDDCITGAQHYSDLHGWEPDGGIEAWCATVVD